LKLNRQGHTTRERGPQSLRESKRISFDLAGLPKGDSFWAASLFKRSRRSQAILLLPSEASTSVKHGLHLELPSSDEHADRRPSAALFDKTGRQKNELRSNEHPNAALPHDSRESPSGARTPTTQPHQERYDRKELTDHV
jgi:hypothetical protein